MNKGYLVTAAFSTLIVVVAATIIISQSANSYSPERTKLSKEEYARMADIIIAVNKGDLPPTALKDAEPLLRQHPEYLSKNITYQLEKEV